MKLIAKLLAKVKGDVASDILGRIDKHAAIMAEITIRVVIRRLRSIRVLAINRKGEIPIFEVAAGQLLGRLQLKARVDVRIRRLA